MTSYAELPLPDDPWWDVREQKINAWLRANGIDHERRAMIEGPTLFGPTIKYTVLIDGVPEKHEVPRAVRPNLFDWHKGAEEAMAARGSAPTPVAWSSFR